MKTKTCQILIVDDDPDYTYLLEEAFKHYKPRPFTKVLQNGDDLLSWLEEAHQLPNLILLDINMPGGNGFELLTILKRVDSFKTIPVVMLSVSSRREDIAKSYRHRANAYIIKPMRFEKLQEQIDLLSHYWTDVIITPRFSWLKSDGYFNYGLN